MNWLLEVRRQGRIIASANTSEKSMQKLLVCQGKRKKKRKETFNSTSFLQRSLLSVFHSWGSGEFFLGRRCIFPAI